MPTKVRSVQGVALNRLEDRPKLRGAERGGNQASRHVTPIQSISKTGKPHLDDPGMIEGERLHAPHDLSQGSPASFGRVIARTGVIDQIGWNERQVGHRDHPHAGVPTGSTKGVELLEVHPPSVEQLGGQTRLFAELAPGGRFEVLALVLGGAPDIHEAPWQRERTFEGWDTSADQEQGKLASQDREDQEVHRDGWLGVPLGIVAFEPLRALRCAPAQEITWSRLTTRAPACAISASARSPSPGSSSTARQPSRTTKT